MGRTLNLPSLGENVEGGDVVKVLVKPGDPVAADQPVLEIETGKATVEVPSPAAGVIEAVLVKPGDKVAIGQPILTVADFGAATPHSSPAPSAAVPEAPTLTPVPVPPPAAPAGGAVLLLPSLGENVDGGDVVKVLVQVGEEVRPEQPILEIETGKATVEVPAPTGGRVDEVLVKPGDKVAVGQPVLRWAAAGARPRVAAQATAAVAAPASPAPAPSASAPASVPSGPIAPEPPPTPIVPPPAPTRIPVAAAPSVRRFAREIGVNIEEVKGSGERGRITIDDVKRHSRQVATGRAVRTHCALEAEPLPDFSKWGAVERETMTKIRVVTAEHLSRAWATIPHVTQHDKADITDLETLRKRLAPRVEAGGGKLTLTAILLKILAAALKVYPKFNASVDLPGRAVIYKKYFHIGVAVDTPRGLLVPVIRDVDRKNILQLSIELTEMARRARDGKVSPDELQGGTFTLTNLGGIGGSFFTPIINAPEVAILGVGRAALEPACGGSGELCRPRLMLPLSLSYDHRLIDGADGARFLRWVVEALQEPMLISLEG